MKDTVTKKFNLERRIILSNNSMRKLYVERLEQFFELAEKSNEWKKNYEYFQRASDVTENLIRVSET